LSEEVYHIYPLWKLERIEGLYGDKSKSCRNCHFLTGISWILKGEIEKANP